MKTKQTSDAVITSDLRQTLKEMFKRELENLPQLLDALEPKERIAILCRIMPFVLPKVEAARHSHDEPLNTDFPAFF